VKFNEAESESLGTASLHHLSQDGKLQELVVQVSNIQASSAPWILTTGNLPKVLNAGHVSLVRLPKLSPSASSATILMLL
jgi:hypothetical protein